MQYVRGSDLTLKAMEAGVSDGTLVPWRRDHAGGMWFQRMPEIHGTPEEFDELPHDVEQFEEDDYFDEDELEDEEEGFDDE